MKILLITDSYPPEIRSASHLMKELAEGLRDRGHEVMVATCYPAYNLSDSALIQEYPIYSVEDNIEVIRIKTLPHHKVNFILRGISQLTLPKFFWRGIKKYFKGNIDVAVVYSPPLPLGYVGYWCKKYMSSKFVLNLQDIFPQNAIDLGALRNPLIIKFFERMERVIYRLADKITVHSEGNKDFLLKSKKITQDKVEVLHNWIDINAYQPKQEDGIYLKKLGIEDKFVILFGGVIGPSQGLDLVIKAAEKISHVQDIVLLIVGDGTEKQKLVKEVQSKGLKNVLFYPFIPKEEYAKLLKEVDVGLVSLSSKNKTPVVPGKILGYMAAGLPILGILNKESDGHSIIKDAECGYSTISDDYSKLAELMVKMYREKHLLREMGYKGYMYAVENFSKDRCIDKIENIFRE
ncbi:MAG: glycosyltransferase family 4 protein [candidate division WOR-3 bacterium]